MNFYQYLLSFIEGVGIILSPCILPVLPLLLATGLQGNKGRPYGVMVGFIITFVSFTLFSRQLLGSVHIDPQLIQNISSGLLVILGCVLFSEYLSGKFNQFTSKVADVGQNLSHTFESQSSDGFWSGLLFGCCIAFLWAPCAGPILAAILVQTIQQKTDSTAAISLFFFALGVGIPMLLITIFGRNLLDRAQFLKTNSTRIRKIVAVIIIGSVLLNKIDFWARLFQWESSSSIKEDITTPLVIPAKAGIQNATGSRIARFSKARPSALPHSASAGQGLTQENRAIEMTPGELQMDNKMIKPKYKLINSIDPYPAPALHEGGEWMNSKPLTLKSLKGKVVLIDFWTYSCINCLRTLPYLKKWHKKYHDKGLIIIGVHAPEFEFEKNKENVEKAIHTFGIEYPVVMDNDLKTWSNFNNHYWPAHYLINQNDQVVYTHFGEGDYDVTENNIRSLLGLDETDSSSPKENAEGQYNINQTPETYLGYERGDSLVSPERVARDEAANYSYPDDMPANAVALKGLWRIEGQKIVAIKGGASLKLRFNAQKVFIVLGSADRSGTSAKIILNGKPIAADKGEDVRDGRVTVSNHKLYEIVSLNHSAEKTVEIVAEKGLEAYAFTFG